MTFGLFLLVLTAAFCHAGWNFVTRSVSGNLVILWLALLTGCFLFLPAALVILWSRGLHDSVSIPGIGYMIATGVVHAIYFLLLAQAYAHGGISHVYPVARGSGVGLTGILAWLLLKEDISVIGAVGIALILTGVVCMGNPFFRKEENSRGFRLALGVGLTIVAYSLIDKMGVNEVNPLLYIWAMFFISAVLLWPFILWRHGGTTLETLKKNKGSILTIGAGSIGTYLLILFAFTMGPVSYIVAIREFAVVIGAVLGIVFLKERLTFLKGIAIVTITVGLVCVKAG